MLPLSSSEIQHIANETARVAVRETLLTMGVDISDPKALLEMQLDMAHTRRVRKSFETIGRQSIIAAVGVVVTTIATAIWLLVSLKGH